LKTQLEEEKRMEEVMKIHMMKKEEYCEKLEEEVISLRVEVDKLKKNLKSSQVLENIISCQRSPFNKTGLGYTVEETCKVRCKYQSQQKRQRERNFHTTSNES
jgi:hypothetical protein